MKTSLEKALEACFIGLYRLNPKLKGKPIFHFANDQIAKTTAIVITAKQGNVNEAGPGGYDAEVSVEYRAPARVKDATNDLVVAGLRDAIYDFSGSTSARERVATNAGLSVLVVKNDTTSDRQNRDNLRIWTIVFQVQAKTKFTNSRKS